MGAGCVCGDLTAGGYDGTRIGLKAGTEKVSLVALFGCRVCDSAWMSLERTSEPIARPRRPPRTQDLHAYLLQPADHTPTHLHHAKRGNCLKRPGRAPSCPPSAGRYSEAKLRTHGGTSTRGHYEASVRHTLPASGPGAQAGAWRGRHTWGGASGTRPPPPPPQAGGAAHTADWERLLTALPTRVYVSCR
jgi:hypothetical protein